MRPKLKYKPVSAAKLATLGHAPHMLEFFRKKRAKRVEIDHEKSRLAQIEREAKLHGYSVESRYRMRKGQYQEMLKRQNHACVTCNRPESDFIRRLHVDHNHRTGKVRGILCQACNHILGKCNENPQTLRHLAAYLDFHNSKE